MIKPSEFKPIVDESAALRQASMEEYIDKRLSKGHLTVDGGRSGWLKTDIEAVAEKYRAAGWIVEVGTPTFTFRVPSVER